MVTDRMRGRRPGLGRGLWCGTAVTSSGPVNEVALRHRQAARVLWGACDPLTTPRPLGPLADAGAVGVLYGSAGGLTTTGGRLFAKDSPGIEGSASERDFFGHALTTGDTPKERAGKGIASKAPLAVPNATQTQACHPRADPDWFGARGGRLG